MEGLTDELSLVASRTGVSNQGAHVKAKPVGAKLLKNDSIEISNLCLLHLTANIARHDFGVRFWDGTWWGESASPRFTLVLKHPGALRKMFLSASELTLGEAFIRDDFDIEGNIEAACELGDRLLTQKRSVTEKLRIGGLLRKLPFGEEVRADCRAPALKGTLHSKLRDRSAVTYHYDVSNDFYALWLDRRMVYSCGYFKSESDTLDAAQEQKLDYVCRKLRLRPGDRLLDLGCGWGGLMLHAATKYGARVFGVTLSAPQAELAEERVRQAGIADRCNVEIKDFRDLKPFAEYDKIVSIGMFEHVGESLLPEYFRRAWALLRPGGVFLNQGIAASAAGRRQSPSFVDKYVFPDGELVPVSTAMRIAESCGFEVRDAESLRQHYVLTLRHWVRRLEAAAEEARGIVGDLKYRVWRLYMSGSAHAFHTNRVNVYQVLLSKPERGESRLPLTREDWYT